MFSPYYAWSGWRDPENHCAMNVALYRAGRDRWAMTERGRGSLSRDQNNLTIGASRMQWDGQALRIDIDEWTAPLPTHVRGAVTVHPEAISTKAYALDANGRHHWRPIAPRARVHTQFDDGALDWSGDAYFDCNWGDESLQHGFRTWDWSRAHTQGATRVYYNVCAREGADRRLALSFDASGNAVSIQPPPPSRLPSTFWRVERTASGAGPEAPRLVRTLEDAPFYARSQLVGRIEGQPADIVHESLSLERFRMPVVQAMLPFRMPRIVGRR